LPGAVPPGAVRTAVDFVRLDEVAQLDAAVDEIGF
jgi:hypothetical protein